MLGLINRPIWTWTIRPRLSNIMPIQEVIQSKYNIVKLNIPENARKYTETLSRESVAYRRKSKCCCDFEKYKQAIASAAEQELGFQGKTERNYWFDKECKEATNQKMLQKRRSCGTLEEYNHLKKVEKKICCQKKRKWERNKLQEIEHTWKYKFN